MDFLKHHKHFPLIVLLTASACGDTGSNPVPSNPVPKVVVLTDRSTYVASETLQFDAINEQGPPIYIFYCNNRIRYVLEQKDSTGWFVREQWATTQCDPTLQSGVLELVAGQSVRQSLLLYYRGIFRLELVYSYTRELTNSRHIYSNEFTVQ